MLRFSLVAFPVQAINAQAREGQPIAFHQLHAECHRHIRYVKQCPIHGEVDKSEIVSGYEYGKGQYVEVDPDELDELRTEQEKALTIDTFIAPDELDPIYFDGRMYFLAPDGDHASEPYTVFLQALERQERYGIGQVVFSGKEQVVVVRPYDIVTSSETGLFGSEKLLDYSSTKGAINAFVKALAQNLVEEGIRVNAVAPGPVWTPLNPADPGLPAAKVAHFGEKTRFKRPAQPDEIAPAFVFFASNADSGFITGHVLPILGGETATG